MRCDHNAMLPEDSNGSGNVTAIDALVVINEIARSARSQSAGSQTSGSQTAGQAKRGNMADVNADGKATAVDALIIINRIGRTSRGGSVASRVPIEDRIHRLAADIESGTLPTNLDITTAKALLARLQSGKLPEVKDIPADLVENDTVDEVTGNGGAGSDLVDDIDLVDDSGTDDSDVGVETPDNPGDDSAGDGVTDDESGDDEESEDITNGTDDSSDPADRLTQLADLVAKRLTAAGASTEVLASVAAAFTLAIDAGKPLTHADVLKLLTDSGVDTTILEKLSHDRPNVEYQDLSKSIDHLSEILLANGNDPAVVETLVTELKAAADAGTPLTREEVNARIVALGLTLPPPKQHGAPDGFDRLKERLLSNGNDPEIVADLIAELAAALEAGTPLSRGEVKTRIEDLGLTLPKPPEMARFDQMVGRIHAIRDAYFASLAASR